MHGRRACFLPVKILLFSNVVRQRDNNNKRSKNFDERYIIASEETRLEAFGMKGMRKILRVSWTAEKTNEWVVNKAGVNSELLDTVKARKLAYYGHTMREQGT